MATVKPSPFGPLLRRSRLAAGLTQEELAERAHLSARGISDLERGVNVAPRRETVELLADALELGDAPRREFQKAAREAALAGTIRVPSPSAPSAAPPLVGRGRELAHLEKLLAGQGPPVLALAGEPGIGKSRLLQEAVHRAGARGYAAIQGGCQRRSGQEPYAPLPEALAGYLAGELPGGAATALEGCAWLVRLLPELAGTIKASHPADRLSPDQERRLMFAAVDRFLRNVAGPAGTLLILDDLQWAGPDLFDLLSALVAASSDLRLAVAYRDTETGPRHPLSDWLADLAGLHRVSHVDLPPLTDADAATLLDSLLDGGDEDGATEARLVGRAGGVPFFLVSYAEGLRSGSVDPAAEIPWDLAQSLRQRVSALPEGSRETLATAAVIGRTVPLPLIRAVLGRPEEEVLGSLDAARLSGLLLEESNTSYRFRHDVVREVVEAELGAARRAALHRRVAEALEGEVGEPYVELLAYHWSRSGNDERAIEYLERAGDRARDRYAWGAAAGYYRDLLERLDARGRTDDAAAVREKLCRILGVTGQFDEALRVGEAALALYQAEGNEEGEERVAAGIAYTYFARGTAREGLVWVHSMLTHLETRPPSVGLGWVYWSASNLHWGVGEYSEDLTMAERAAEVARAVGDEELLARADSARRRAFLYLGRQSEASRAAVQPASGKGGHELIIPGRDPLADHRALVERALQQAVEQDVVLDIVLYRALLGHIAFLMGDWALARRQSEEALRLARSVGPSAAAPGPLMDLGLLCLCEGDRLEAERWLLEALDVARRADDLFAQRTTQDRLAQLDLLEGRPEVAANRLTPLLDRPGFEEVQVTGILPTLARAYLEMGDAARAEVIVGDAIRRARAQANRLDLLRALHVRGTIEASQGRPEAEQTFEEALAIARDLPFPYMEAQLQHDLGVLWGGRGEAKRARSLLEEALQIFRRLGAKDDIRRTEEALAGFR